jgi:hypothetical protein
MQMIALGSTALNHYYRLRNPKDLDVVIHFDDLLEFKEKYELVSLEPRSANKFHGLNANGKHFEIEVAGLLPESSTDLLYNLGIDSAAQAFSDAPFFVDANKSKSDFIIPPIELLYHIKMCHRFKFSPHFEKTRNDILFLERLVNKTVFEDWKPFLDARKEEANKKTPKLNVTKDEFFVDKYGDVPQIVHDTIHLTQALDGDPAYTNFQVGEVQCCMKTYFSLDEQIRLNAVFEESATLAVERAIWPSQFKADEYKSFKGSLQRLCCHISSGKFRDCCWENYDNVLAMYRRGDIVKKFKEGLKDETIQFQNGEHHLNLVGVEI